MNRPPNSKVNLDRAIQRLYGTGAREELAAGRAEGRERQGRERQDRDHDSGRFAVGLHDPPVGGRKRADGRGSAVA